MFETIDDALAFIHGRPKQAEANTLTRMQTLLKEVGNPQLNLPPVVHVVGTNGKGSTATMISHILVTAGYKTGLFVSPFLIDFRERIQVDNQWISPADLIKHSEIVAKAVQRMEAENPRAKPTEFEVLTVIMLSYFVACNLDVAVIEAGIGGRYDSTNVLPTAKVAVITSIAYDHCNLLGNTLTEIARQKAGVIHPGMKVVVGKLPEKALAVIKGEGQPVIQGILGKFKSGLAGQYQIQNTATAVAAIRALDWQIDDNQIRKGLEATDFVGRFETVSPQILLDGAHNAAGLRALYQALKVLYRVPITLAIGSLADKNICDFLPTIQADAQFKVILVPFVGPNGRESLDVTDWGSKLSLPVCQRWQDLLLKVEPDQLLVFTGSLYFVSEVRKQLWQTRNN